MNRWPHWSAGAVAVLFLLLVWTNYLTADIGSDGVSIPALIPSIVLAAIGCGMAVRALVLVLREKSPEDD